MSGLNRDYGTVEFDNLVNKGGDVGTIQLAAGQGTLKKGSVIDKDGKLLAESATAAYVLSEDVETDDEDTVTGIVYKNGNFVRNSLIVAQGYTFTDANAEQLRAVGIIVEIAK